MALAITKGDNRLETPRTLTADVTMTLASQSAKLEQSRGGGLKSSQKRYSKKSRVALVPPGPPRPHSTNVRRLHGSAEKESADSTDDHRAPRSPRGFFFVQTRMVSVPFPIPDRCMVNRRPPRKNGPPPHAPAGAHLAVCQGEGYHLVVAARPVPHPAESHPRHCGGVSCATIDVPVRAPRRSHRGPHRSSRCTKIFGP